MPPLRWSAYVLHGDFQCTVPRSDPWMPAGLAKADGICCRGLNALQGMVKCRSAAAAMQCSGWLQHADSECKACLGRQQKTGGQRSPSALLSMPWRSTVTRRAMPAMTASSRHTVRLPARLYPDAMSMSRHLRSILVSAHVLSCSLAAAGSMHAGLADVFAYQRGTGAVAGSFVTQPTTSWPDLCAGSEGRPSAQRTHSAPRMSLDSQKSETAAALAASPAGKGPPPARTRSLQVRCTRSCRRVWLLHAWAGLKAASFEPDSNSDTLIHTAWTQTASDFPWRTVVQTVAPCHGGMCERVSHDLGSMSTVSTALRRDHCSLGDRGTPERHEGAGRSAALRAAVPKAAWAVRGAVHGVPLLLRSSTLRHAAFGTSDHDCASAVCCSP